MESRQPASARQLIEGQKNASCPAAVVPSLPTSVVQAGCELPLRQSAPCLPVRHPFTVLVPLVSFLPRLSLAGFRSHSSSWRAAAEQRDVMRSTVGKGVHTQRAASGLNTGGWLEGLAGERQEAAGRESGDTKVAQGTAAAGKQGWVAKLSSAWLPQPLTAQAARAERAGNQSYSYRKAGWHTVAVAAATAAVVWLWERDLFPGPRAATHFFRPLRGGLLLLFLLLLFRLLLRCRRRLLLSRLRLPLPAGL